MKTGVMQPYFFPYIGYWQLLNCVDKYVLLDDVNYIKRGWINRNRIILNNSVHYVNLPVVDASQNKKIVDVGVDISRIDEFLNRIREGYRKAKHFPEVFDTIVGISKSSDTSNVATYLRQTIQSLCNYIGINTDILFSSEIEKKDGLKGEEMVVDICKELNTDHYINAIGGTELYHAKRFEREGIRLSFLKSKLSPYKQFDNEFIPALSIIDVLMFCGADGTSQMLSDFDLLDA